MCSDSNALLKRLNEIRKACAVATSPKDSNLNLIIEEIDQLAAMCINGLGKK